MWPDLAKFRQFGKQIQVFGNNCEGAFSICQNFEPTLANFLSWCANLYCWQWPNIEHTIYHLVTLTMNGINFARSKKLIYPPKFKYSRQNYLNFPLDPSFSTTESRSTNFAKRTGSLSAAPSATTASPASRWSWSGTSRTTSSTTTCPPVGSTTVVFLIMPTYLNGQITASFCLLLSLALVGLKLATSE